MTEHAAADSIQAVVDEIDRTRRELSETARALVAKADVKALARDKKADVQALAREKARDTTALARGKSALAREKAAEVAGRVSGSGPGVPAYLVVAAAGAALLAGWLIVRRVRG
jgi:Protein of unknown function (DUF3618)